MADRVGRRKGHSWSAWLLGLALIGIWELADRLFNVPDYLFSAPDQIGAALWQERETLGSATLVTVEEMVLGFVIALAAGLLSAFLLHTSALARRAFYPLLIASQTVPVVVLAPILAIVFGYTILPKLVVVALVCFFPVAVNTLDGLQSVDPELIRLMRTLDANAWGIFRRVELPSALPLVFSGARVAATFAAIGAVFGEWSGSTDGLGYVMRQAMAELRTPVVFAAIVILTAASVGLFQLVSLAQRLIAPWAYLTEEGY
jgi:putative hydroxymethylpyrimidine transport system permease protein